MTANPSRERAAPLIQTFGSHNSPIQREAWRPFDVSYATHALRFRLPSAAAYAALARIGGGEAAADLRRVLLHGGHPRRLVRLRNVSSLTQIESLL